MIQANEAVVGRWFSRKHGKGHTWTQLDEKIVGLIFSDSTGYALDDFDPIPLTPEILEKCFGFTRRFPTDDCNIWDWDKASEWNKNFSLALLEAGWKYLGAPSAKPFKYLHQLQNLYFALTGQELTINL